MNNSPAAIRCLLNAKVGDAVVLIYRGLQVTEIVTHHMYIPGARCRSAGYDYPSGMYPCSRYGELNPRVIKVLHIIKYKNNV